MARSINASAKARRYKVPGMWEHARSRYLRMIEQGDPRIMHDFAPGLTDAEREAYNAHQHSGPSWARRRLAAMDAQGWVSTGPPSAREFPEAAAVPWLAADRSVQHVRVYADDYIEPAPQLGHPMAELPPPSSPSTWPPPSSTSQRIA
jgi:hypothetical protein